jgi:glycogen phosphorylase
MIERINSGIGMSYLQTATVAKFHADRRNSNLLMLPRSASQTLKRDREFVDTQKLTLAPPLRTSDLDQKFNPRQWVLSANPQLANLVTKTIGDRWIDHPEHLQQLAPLAVDPLLQSRWRSVKQVNKQVLASYLDRSQGIKIDVSSLFSLQLQPIVEHQRQLLNILHIVALFNQIKQEPGINIVPRTFIFGNLGELESTPIPPDQDCSLQQQNSRDIITLIQSLAKFLANDPDVNGKLQIVYIPDSAGLTNQMYAAADLTQEIATASIEDIDLTKLKAAINGVLSIGSMGKTNCLLRQAVGEENYFSFGLTIPEIALFEKYGYNPYNYYKHYPPIRQAIDCLLVGSFTPENPSLCKSLINALFGTDEQMVLADYIFYATCQTHISKTYLQKSTWTKMSILNVAGVG